MRIALAVPARPGVNSGNSVTGDRWARRFTELGHEVVRIEVTADGTGPAGREEIPRGQAPRGPAARDPAARGPVAPGPVAPGPVAPGPNAGPIDVLVALHARRCATVVADSAARFPARPIVVGLAGTDLYSDLPDDPDALASCRLATHLVVLQEDGIEHLRRIDPSFADKASVVHQSVEPRAEATTPSHASVPPASSVPPGAPPTSGVPVRPAASDRFVVVVLAHLRDVKDPLMAARSARLLPADSTVHVEHAGSPHDDRWRERATHEDAENDRYTWLGALDAADAHRLLARADALACTSLLEGGANVVSEAIALGLPVVGTDIGGTRGLIGADHPGLVPVGDDQALADVFRRMETDGAFLADLAARSHDRRWMVDPAHERSRWDEVLRELVG